MQGFLTTTASKPAAIEGSELALKRGELRILDDPVLIAEMHATVLGSCRQGWSGMARSGQHDDTAMALALAWYVITEARNAPRHGDRDD